MINSISKAMGGRKVLTLALMLVVSVAVVALKGDVPSNFKALLELIFSGFVVGNGIEHVTGAVKVHAASKTQEPNIIIPTNDDSAVLEHCSDIKNETELLSGSIKEIAHAVAIVQQSLSLIIKRTGIDRMQDPKV